MSNQKMDGAQALIRTLDDLGIEYIFGYSGGAAIPIFDALETTPFSPPSGPPQRLFHEHPAKSKFLATQLRFQLLNCSRCVDEFQPEELRN